MALAPSREVSRTTSPLSLQRSFYGHLDVVDENRRFELWFAHGIAIDARAYQRRLPPKVPAALNVAIRIVTNHPYLHLRSTRLSVQATGWQLRSKHLCRVFVRQPLRFAEDGILERPLRQTLPDVGEGDAKGALAEARDGEIIAPHCAPEERGIALVQHHSGARVRLDTTAQFQRVSR